MRRHITRIFILKDQGRDPDIFEAGYIHNRVT